MAFPTSSLTNNQVHKEGNRAFVYDSALGVWDQVRETDRTENKILQGEIGAGVTFPAGHVVQTVQSSYTTHWTQVMNTTATEYANNGTEDLNVTITPTVASHKIHLILSFGAVCAKIDGAGHGLGVLIHRNSTGISLCASSASAPNTSFRMGTDSHQYDPGAQTYHFIDTPGITTQCVYKIRCWAHSSSNYTTGWNRGQTAGNDGNAGYKSTTATNFIAMEVVA